MSAGVERRGEATAASITPTQRGATRLISGLIPSVFRVSQESRRRLSIRSEAMWGQDGGCEAFITPATIKYLQLRRRLCA